MKRLLKGHEENIVTMALERFKGEQAKEMNVRDDQIDEIIQVINFEHENQDCVTGMVQDITAYFVKPALEDEYDIMNLSIAMSKVQAKVQKMIMNNYEKAWSDMSKESEHWRQEMLYWQKEAKKKVK